MKLTSQPDCPLLWRAEPAASRQHRRVFEKSVLYNARWGIAWQSFIRLFNVCRLYKATTALELRFAPELLFCTDKKENAVRRWPAALESAV